MKWTRRREKEKGAGFVSESRGGMSELTVCSVHTLNAFLVLAYRTSKSPEDGIDVLQARTKTLTRGEKPDYKASQIAVSAMLETAANT